LGRDPIAIVNPASLLSSAHPIGTSPGFTQAAWQSNAYDYELLNDVEHKLKYLGTAGSFTCITCRTQEPGSRSERKGLHGFEDRYGFEDRSLPTVIKGFGRGGSTLRDCQHSNLHMAQTQRFCIFASGEAPDPVGRCVECSVPWIDPVLSVVVGKMAASASGGLDAGFRWLSHFAGSILVDEPSENGR
jgi:hypothetical protein